MKDDRNLLDAPSSLPPQITCPKYPSPPLHVIWGLYMAEYLEALKSEDLGRTRPSHVICGGRELGASRRLRSSFTYKVSSANRTIFSQHQFPPHRLHEIFKAMDEYLSSTVTWNPSECCKSAAPLIPNITINPPLIRSQYMKQLRLIASVTTQIHI